MKSSFQFLKFKIQNTRNQLDASLFGKYFNLVFYLNPFLPKRSVFLKKKIFVDDQNPKYYSKKCFLARVLNLSIDSVFFKDTGSLFQMVVECLIKVRSENMLRIMNYKIIISRAPSEVVNNVEWLCRVATNLNRSDK